MRVGVGVRLYSTTDELSRLHGTSHHTTDCSAQHTTAHNNHRLQRTATERAARARTQESDRQSRAGGWRQRQAERAARRQSMGPQQVATLAQLWRGAALATPEDPATLQALIDQKLRQAEDAFVLDASRQRSSKRISVDGLSLRRSEQDLHEQG